MTSQVMFCQRVTCTELAQAGSRLCSRHSHRTVTVKAQQVLDFVRTFTATNQYPPTVREIGRALHIGSTNTVAYHLNSLEAAGLIERTPEVARGIKVVEVGNVRDAEPVVSAVGR